MLGWTADLLRTIWGLFYWNTRKTLFRVRGRRGACPCQNLSDSGRAGETDCDAILQYAKPVRFRTVCPLLQPNAAGKLKCSVAAADVRPFWGRAAGLVAAALVIVWLTVVLAVFGVMRVIGYPVTLTMLAWPPAWEQLDRARSTYFLGLAETAYQSGDAAQAVMSLSLAYEYDPTHYDAGLLLANLWQTGRAEMSNRLYQRLIVDHPDQRERTARAWLRGLLPRGDFGSVETLAATALRFDSESAAAWLNALLFATRRTGNDALLGSLLEEPTALPPGAAEVLQLEFALRTRPASEAFALLSTPLSADAPSFVFYHRVRGVVDAGDAEGALRLLAAVSSRLSDRDRLALQLHALAADPALRERYLALLDQISRLAPSQVLVELVCAHLIPRNDAEAYALVRPRLDPLRIEDSAQRLPSLLARYCLATSQNDAAGAEQLAVALREASGSQYAALGLVQAMAREPGRFRVETVLPTLQPLSLELTYAMLERYARRDR